MFKINKSAQRSQQNIRLRQAQRRIEKTAVRRVKATEKQLAEGTVGELNWNQDAAPVGSI